MDSLIPTLSGTDLNHNSDVNLDDRSPWNDEHKNAIVFVRQMSLPKISMSFYVNSYLKKTTPQNGEFTINPNPNVWLMLEDHGKLHDFPTLASVRCGELSCTKYRGQLGFHECRTKTLDDEGYGEGVAAVDEDSSVICLPQSWWVLGYARKLCTCSFKTPVVWNKK